MQQSQNRGRRLIRHLGQTCALVLQRDVGATANPSLTEKCLLIYHSALSLYIYLLEQ